MKILITLLLLALSLNTFAKSASISIVTDLDDTIKRTGTDFAPRTLYNGPFTRRTFSGMPQLYQSMNKRVMSTMVLSATPKLLRKRVESFLDKFNFKADKVVLRDLRKNRNVFQYKLDAIEDFLNSHNHDVILIGDNSGHDTEVYLEIKKRYPKRVLAIYIRMLKLQEFSSEVTPFISAYDIAFFEALSSRLSLNELWLIGKEVAGEVDDDRLIYSGHYCPELGAIHPVREPLSLLVAARIHEVCKKEKK